MKRLSAITYLYLYLLLPICAQDYSLDRLATTLEEYADSSSKCNWHVAESFAYDLLGFLNFINIYGPNSEKTLQRFADKTYIDYSRFIANIREDVLKEKYWKIDVDYEISLSIINLYRNFLYTLENNYGKEYLDRLKQSYTLSMNALMQDNGDYENYHYNLQNRYYEYDFSLLEETYNDELVLNLIYDKIPQFLTVFNSLLTSDISEEAKAELTLNGFDVLYDHNNPTIAENILSLWIDYELKRDHSNYRFLSEYIERARTKRSVMALNNKDYFLAYMDVSLVDNVLKEGFLNYYIDVNEFLRQLEIRAMVEINMPTDDNPEDKVLKYFEYADSLITHDARCLNNEPVTPATAGIIYSQLAQSYLNRNEINLAEEAIFKAKNIVGAHFDYSTSLSQAIVFIRNYKYEVAKELLYKCLEVQSVGKYSLSAQKEIYSLLLSIALEENNDEVIRQTAETYYTLQRDFYYKRLSLLPSYNRSNYWANDYSLQYMTFLAGTIASRLDSCAYIGYDAALFQKGLLLRFDGIERENVMNSGDEVLIKAYNEMKSSMRPNVPDSVRLESMDRYSLMYAKHQEFISNINHLSWTQVRESLEPNEVAIEFIETYDEDYNDYVYGAYLLKSNFDAPIYITLCSSDKLKSLLRNPIRGGYYPSIYNSPIVQTEMYNLIWGKIEKYLTKGSTIHFSPYGLLSQINIEILANENDQTPINQRYEINRISSTGLLVDTNSEISYESAILMGDIDYNSNVYSANETIKNDTYISTFSRGMAKLWEPLSHTKDEVENIERLLQKSKINTSVFQSEYASEGNFKSLSYSVSSIIHIATHGFYFSHNDARKWDYFSMFSAEESDKYISPMQRSGLVLAGGNHAWSGKEIPVRAEDGILSAQEIANLNLSNTDLVVLSACQTGLGELSNDGVSGIQRGFKLAGVKTLIMSLWEVNDEATAIMMKNFYKHLTKGKSKKESFNSAIQAVKKWNDDPYYWAAFIMLD